MSSDPRPDPIPDAKPAGVSLEAIAHLFRSETLEEGLALGTRLIATVAEAPVAAVFLLRGGEIAESHWHLLDPAHKARFEECLAKEVTGNSGDTPDTTRSGEERAPCGAPILIVTVPGEHDPATVAAIAWPNGAPGSVAVAKARVRQVLEVVAARVALHEWNGRFDAQRVRYERWFRTLDQQLRLLDRERQKFSAVVQQSDIHVFVADVSGTIHWTNKSMSELLPESDWLGRSCHDLCGSLIGREGGCSSCPLANTVDYNRVSHHELHAAHGGTSRTLYMTALPIRGPDGKPHEVMVLLQDLTDLRVVRKSESRYRLLFERSANAIVMVEPQRQRLVLSNPMTARMLGYPAEQLAGRALRELIAADQWPRIEALCSSISAAGALEGFECRLKTRDGGERAVVVSPSRFDLDGAEVLLLEFLDVTERKQAEQALHEREHQLRQSQKMEAVGRLAGGIAHGFNNLLAVIMGRIGLMRERLPAEHPMRRDAEQIHNACVQGSWLTRHLLAFSRKEMTAPRVIDLRTVLSEMDGMLRCVLSEKIELVTATGLGAAPVLADPAQIEQVLLNLVINARDAMPNGGVITVDLSQAQVDAATAREKGASGAGSYWKLTVSDDGIGMDEETRARLFEPFFTTKDRSQASGLGMSVVYGTVSQAGGHVEVSSEVGLGTTVAVYLPRATDATPVGIDDTPVAATVADGEVVLVVEDDEPVRAVTCEALEMEGYIVMSACNGQEALDLVNHHRGRLDLMVTDVVMPGMSGGELARRLATVRPETKVIFVSGYVDDVIVRDGVMAAGAPFLQKPFQIDALASKAREVLDGSGPMTTPRPEGTSRATGQR